MRYIYHGEHVAGVGGALLVAGGLSLLVENSGDGETKVGSEQMDEDGVARVHCLEEVPAYDLVNDEKDRLHHRHHDQLDGRGHPWPTRFS